MEAKHKRPSICENWTSANSAVKTATSPQQTEDAVTLCREAWRFCQNGTTPHCRWGRSHDWMPLFIKKKSSAQRKITYQREGYTWLLPYTQAFREGLSFIHGGVLSYVPPICNVWCCRPFKDWPPHLVFEKTGPKRSFKIFLKKTALKVITEILFLSKNWR